MKINRDSHAVTQRLRQASDLRDVCLILGGKRLIHRLRQSGALPGPGFQPTDQRARARSGMVDELQGVDLERRDGTNCLRVIDK